MAPTEPPQPTKPMDLRDKQRLQAIMTKYDAVFSDDKLLQLRNIMARRDDVFNDDKMLRLREHMGILRETGRVRDQEPDSVVMEEDTDPAQLPTIAAPKQVTMYSGAQRLSAASSSTSSVPQVKPALIFPKKKTLANGGNTRKDSAPLANEGNTRRDSALSANDPRVPPNDAGQAEGRKRSAVFPTHFTNIKRAREKRDSSDTTISRAGEVLPRRESLPAGGIQPARGPLSGRELPSARGPAPSAPASKAGGSEPVPGHGISPRVYRPEPVLPLWYSQKEKVFNHKRVPQLLRILQELKRLILLSCATETLPEILDGRYQQLRTCVHQAEVTTCAPNDLEKYVKETNILDQKVGLPRIFMNNTFPPDLISDSFQLYNRWIKRNFDQDILRGIVKVKQSKRNADNLDKEYKVKFPTDAKIYGDNNLVIGQWWPTQLCALRDGAHGSAQGGISGSKIRGACSIIISSGTYNDMDFGDTIHYHGTPGQDSEPTDVTKHMLRSFDLGNKIRVIRSGKHHESDSAEEPNKPRKARGKEDKSHEYRPVAGLRYDGLYVVKEKECVDEKLAHYIFTLERCEGQEPIRTASSVSPRPTSLEYRAFMNTRGLN
ncbi:hypothetical protein IQ07DRAFT_590098 [Pyrenochaeta sp. DS3sAY3a]|nr:hypothetical protein IQ07DRAFT_590098 [Pyrenochaeta sp. DS3sAY3a]